MAHRLMYVDLVILDELGYLPFSQAGRCAAVPPALEAL
jgi:DNA replication protein DnaC